MLVCEGRTEVAYVLFATPLLDRRSSESTVSRGRNFTPQQREEPDNMFKLSSFRQDFDVMPSDESSEMQLPNTVMYGAWADRCTANRSQERERVGRKCLFIRTRGCSEEGATVLDFREDDTASTGFLCWMIIKSKPMFRKIESLNCKPLTDQEELTTGSSHFGNKRC
ncbi:hypothetical protein M758_12G005300 [Ceratodon purpureus]|uniref:Uncharacterized protein n=1 Tax=Ceratodon purpureus TaxID=3225 RepID=A0A8T0G4H9_CERPU|nr:hypothetical protein KC19_12G005000 [Ceratodon purpureus]KAG0597569.1 hypothetical protein M758_12G005300 [Ceratodon purpureus]